MFTASTNTPTPEMITSYVYNKANQVCWQTAQSVSSPTCSSPIAGSLTKTYAYNDDGEICWISVQAVSNASCSVVPGSETTSYTYNDLTEVISQQEPFGSLTGQSNSSNTTSYIYDRAGNLLSATLSNGLSNIYAYNSSNEVTGQTVGEIGTSTDITSTSCGGYIPFYGVYATYCYGVATQSNGTQALVANTTGNFIYTNLPSNIASVSSISCASISVCFATSIGTTGTISLIETSDSGATWSTQTTLPFDANSTTQISCISTTNCYVTGLVSGTTDLYTVSYSGSAWSSTSDGAVGQSVSSLNCPSSTVCYMAGTSSSTGYITGYNSGTFTTPTSFSSTELNSISCANITQCIAVGQSSIGQGSSSAAIITTTTGTSWSNNSVTIPTSYKSLTSVSCPLSSSLTDCYTVGVSTTSTPVIGHITYSSPNFSITDESSLIPYGTKSLNTVGCGYSTSCMALGSTNYSSAQVLYSTNSGSTWPMLFGLNTYSYDGSGNMYQSQDGLGTTSMQYDSLGRLISRQDDIGNITSYSYDNDSNITCVGYHMSSMSAGCTGSPSSSNPIVTYAYDNADRMSSLQSFMAPGQTSCGTLSIPTDSIDFSYDANGNLTSSTLPLCDTSSPPTLDSLNYALDANNSITGITLNFPTGLKSVTETRNALSMLETNLNGINTAYNGQGQLTYSSTTALTSTTPATYTYDNQGNLLVSPNASYSQCFSTGGELLAQYTLASPPTSCTSASPGPVNTYTYDSQGNRISYTFPWNGGTSSSFNQYDNLGRLSQYSVFFTGWNYYYGANGQLMRATSGSSNLATLTYNADTSQILSDGTFDYVYGPFGIPVEAFKPSTASSQVYLLTGDNNTVFAGLNTSNSGAFLINYGTFGNTGSPASGEPQLGYDGAYYAPGINMWLMGNRMYDSSTGIFINPDPSISLANQPYSFAGYMPATGDPSNYYTFANNDPANLSDSSGLSCFATVLLFSIAGVSSQVGHSYGGPANELADALDFTTTYLSAFDGVSLSPKTAMNAVEDGGGIARDTGENVVGEGASDTGAVFRSDTSHIFRDAVGHLAEDTPENRQLLQGAIDPVNLRQTITLRDGSLLMRYLQTLPDGTQVWVEVRNGMEITNGGLNATPR